MNEALQAIGFMAALTGILAVVLALANKRLKVFEDPRIDAVADLLPGNNCGACGEPGCRAFAEKAVAGKVSPGDCTPSSLDIREQIANYLGVDVGGGEKRVARLHCAGGSNVAIQLGEYQGHQSCRSAAAVGGGTKGCRYGCLGLADCEVVCMFHALKMGPTGLPVVDFDACTACGDCVDICPKNLFEIVPASHKLIVQCKSELEGDQLLDLCKVACTACGKCVADAAQGLLTMKNNLPVLDPELLHLQAPEATSRCASGAIVWLEREQFPADSEEQVGSPQHLNLERDHVVS